MNIEADVDRIVESLRLGQLAIVPTDTVYGLAADPASESAMRRLFRVKERPEGVPVAVLVDSVEQAESLVVVDRLFRDLAMRYWPGALTIVANARPHNGLYIGDLSTVGVRLPDDALMRRCARRFGPIAASSANLHGAPTIREPEELQSLFGAEVGLIIDRGVLGDVASTVVDISSGHVEILREGSVQLEIA